MRSIIFLVFILMLALTTGYSQTQTIEAKATASISGKVLVSGKAVRGIKVVAISGKPQDYNDDPCAYDLTDEKGRYHLKGLAAGSYSVKVDHFSLTGKPKEKATKDEQVADKDDTDEEEDEEEMDDDEEDSEHNSTTRLIKVKEAAEVKDIDFQLIWGGVITGRVTDTNGRPLIGEDITVVPFREGKRDNQFLINSSLFAENLRIQTDDRGIYRAFSLPPGRYQVSVGEPYEKAGILSFKSIVLPLTYYTGASTDGKPAAVEVTSGGEVTGIDIIVARPSKADTYAAKGRVVDAVTGKPIPNVSVHCRAEKGYPSGCWGESNARGEFRIDKLTGGKYLMDVWTRESSNWYSDEVAFEIANGDTTGIELRAYPTASISGVVVIENTKDPVVLAKVPELRVGKSRLGMPTSMSILDGVKVNADGSFLLTKLSPEKTYSISDKDPSEVEPVMLDIVRTPEAQGFIPLRVERDGVEQPKGFMIKAGETITGVRLVLGYYSGKIRGKVKIEGGSIPKNALFIAEAVTISDKQKMEAARTGQGNFKEYFKLSAARKVSRVEPDGSFLLEWLPPEVYEVAVSYTQFSNPSKDQRMNIWKVSKTVTVTDGGEAEITLILDLSKPPDTRR